MTVSLAASQNLELMLWGIQVVPVLQIPCFEISLVESSQSSRKRIMNIVHRVRVHRDEVSWAELILSLFKSITGKRGMGYYDIRVLYQIAVLISAHIAVFFSAEFWKSGQWLRACCQILIFMTFFHPWQPRFSLSLQRLFLAILGVQ